MTIVQEKRVFAGFVLIVIDLIELGGDDFTRTAPPVIGDLVLQNADQPGPQAGPAFKVCEGLPRP